MATTLDPFLIESFLRNGHDDKLFDRLARCSAITLMVLAQEYGQYAERDWRFVLSEWEREIGFRYTTYLLHLDRPVGNPEKKYGTAQHYVGYSRDPWSRLKQHRREAWSRRTALLYAANQQKIEYRIVRLWPGGFRTERLIKGWKHNRQICPVCNPDGWANWAEKWIEKEA